MDPSNYVVLLAIFCLRTLLVASQCDQRQFGGSMMCCGGRNSNCYVKIRDTVKNSTRSICYCDEYCKLTRDCCADFDKIRDSCRGEFT